MATKEELIAALANAKSYDEWIDLSKQIDIFEDHIQWQAEDDSPLYDYRKLHGILVELRQARLQKNIPKLLYLVRTALSRNVANMGDPRLFTHTRSGTKHLIDEFINECELVLETLVIDIDESQASDILNTLVQTRKAFGRTALVFSGGSILGFLHAGVTRELIEHKLLPRIISGSSAGSIFASMLCIHRDEEFDKMWELLNIPMSIFGPSEKEESLFTHLTRFFTLGTWIDSTYLKEMMQGLIGDITFQEAYNRTGRILNVNVSVAGSHDMPRLLNYLTSPNVVIWSAVVCSCSVPFVFAADSIFAKNPKTKEIYPWTKRAFIDGSVDNDMPLTRLSELFNVNHFVACQVNPHIAPLFTQDRGHQDGITNLISDEPGKKKSWIRSGVQAGRALIMNEVEHGLTILKKAGVAPAVSSTVLNVIGQEYWGDITIVPSIHWSDVGRLFKNPTAEVVQDLITRGRKATWPKLALIRNHCAIEVALDKAIVDLRSNIIATVLNSRNASPTQQQHSRTLLPTHHHRYYNSSYYNKSHWDHPSGIRSQSAMNLASIGRAATLTRTNTTRSPWRRTSVDAVFESPSKKHHASTPRRTLSSSASLPSR